MASPSPAQLYEAAARPAPGVVLVHMLSRTRKRTGTKWRSSCEAAGITALAIDLRGHGGSGGAATALCRDGARRPRRGAVAVGRARASVRTPSAWPVRRSAPTSPCWPPPTSRWCAPLRAVSPSLDYRGLPRRSRDDEEAGRPPGVAGGEHRRPLSLRTMKELTADESMPSATSTSAPSRRTARSCWPPTRTLARALVDWLRQRLLS